MSIDNKITEVLDVGIKARVFPGAIVGYIKNGQNNFVASGHLTYDRLTAKINKNTIYDMASITKSIPVNSIILNLLGKKRLSLEDRVVKYIPELQFEYKNDVLIKHLLTYTVVWDMPNGLSYYARQGYKAVLDAIYDGPLMAPPGQKYYYTNPPSILLTLIIERLCGKNLESVAKELFFKPLNMHSTTFYPKLLKDRDIAPSEIDFRGEIKSEVHDEAAWALGKINKLAGNAGLFSDAEDLLKFSWMLINGGVLNNKTYFSSEFFKQIYTNQIANLDSIAGLGWELNQPHFMGTKTSSECFGKTGFTGTSILVDPIKQVSIVILTNRTYPKRPKNSYQINDIRSKIADIIMG